MDKGSRISFVVLALDLWVFGFVKSKTTAEGLRDLRSIFHLWYIGGHRRQDAGLDLNVAIN